MEITTELIKTIYKRANEAAIAKFGNGEPDTIELYEGGKIQVVWTAYNRDCDDDKEFLNAEDLTADMDLLVEQRKIKEKEDRRLRDIYNIGQQKIRDNIDKINRKSTYLKLKKEFE